MLNVVPLDPTHQAEETTPLSTVKNAARHVEALLAQGRNAEAVTFAETYVRNNPDDALAWNILGVASRVCGKPGVAAAAYTRALEISPRYVAAIGNLGNAWRDLQRFDEAIACHRATLAIAPDVASHWANLGVALRDAARYEESLTAYDKALQIDPGNSRTRLDRGQVLLMLGHYKPGWTDFEARWNLPELQTQKLKTSFWDGREHPSKTLLLWPEQGFGDTILCSRFIAPARARVGSVILVCQPELKPLFEALPGVDRIVAKGQPLPSYDLHAPLMSLPRFFAGSLAEIPPPPALRAPESARARVGPFFERVDGCLKIGIVWSGSLTFKNNHLRAASLERFLDLATVPGVRLFSLQKGPRREDIQALGASAIVEDMTPLLNDFADTAAAIEQLDLVVMTDSSVAHLTGSMGKPIWNILPRMPYWLYGPEGETTPWYSSMRLFRQPSHGDWDGVFAAVKQALSRAVRDRGLFR